MVKISLKVQKDKARTPEEAYWYLWGRLGKLGDFVTWEVHPNIVRADNIASKKLWKKFKELVDSEEYKHYTATV